MRLAGSILEAPRLLPAPRGRLAAPAFTPEPVRPALPAAARPAVWMLSRETASAAFSAQMLAAPKRGLKADPAERARFARAYQSWGLPQPGLIANDNV